MAEVKLHGFWCSPFTYRVIWALKLKGVEFEYIEEDLSDKSELLLQYNPVHKKVPVLVHGGKPVAESLIILEYIEETWPDKYPLLPKDPYERAMSRFWINFGVQKAAPVFHEFFKAAGEEAREKAPKDVLEVLKIIEEQALVDNKFFGGDAISLLDICFGTFTHWFEAMEEMLGIKVVQPSTLPKLHEWTKNFKQVPEIRENLPDYDKLLAYFLILRDKFAENVQK